MNNNVVDFIRWAVGHAKKTSLAGDIEGTPGLNPWEYLYGTTGNVVTQDLLKRKFDSYYSKHGWSIEEYGAITQPWLDKETIVTDCQGLLDCYTGVDVNADYNFRHYCTDKGAIGEIVRPWVIGEAVFNGSDSKKTHVGWVCGFAKDGTPLVVEARGIRYGVCITSMKTREWKYRGLMLNVFDYSAAPIQPVMSKLIFTRILKKGMKGDDVAELKRLLIAHGYTAGISAENDNFGANTKKMVKAFQMDAGLTVDGIAGKKTIRALGGTFR